MKTYKTVFQQILQDNTEKKCRRPRHHYKGKS